MTPPWATAPPVVGGQSFALHGLEGRVAFLLLKGDETGFLQEFVGKGPLPIPGGLGARGLGNQAA